MVQSKTVLVTGGSGYLGQFLVEDLGMAGYAVASTHLSSAVPALAGSARAFPVDLATGVGLSECLASLGPIAAVINCAAVSSPAACERDPVAARRAVNVPVKLLDALERHARSTGARPLFVQLSTDQVYAGTRSWWTEDEACEPVNAYGRTKLEAEAVIQCPTPVPRALFLQFIDRALMEGTPTTFFDDEFRCPVWVDDIKAVMRTLVSGAREPLQQRLLNMGGPERLSRVDMAHAVAETWGRDPAAIQAAPAASVSRGVAAPPDISMRIDRLVSTLGIRPVAFADALARMPSAPSGALPSGNFRQAQ